MFSQVHFPTRLSQRLIRQIKENCRKCSSQGHILTEKVNNNAIVTLNRPQSLNATTATLHLDLIKQLKKIEKESMLVVLKGAGDRAFCAGGDLIKIKEAGETNNVKYLHDMTVYSHFNIYVIFKYKIPIIAFMNGITFGGGAGLAIFCKYRIATEKTKFGMPEAKIAFHPNTAGTYFFNRLPDWLGYYMALTGNSLCGSDVVQAGFATHFCRSDNLERLEEELLNCSNEDEIRYVVERNCEKTIHPFSLNPIMDNVNNCFSSKTIEDIFLKLEQDGSAWAKETIDVLNKYSPTCLKVILRQLQKGRTMSLADCLLMETNLTFNFNKFSDLYEGIRTTLVDRKDTPKWRPSRLSDVTEQLVEAHFKPSVGESLKLLLKEADEENKQRD